MSNFYYLICMKCKAGVHLGKTVQARYKAVEKSAYGFSSLGHTGEDGWRGEESSLADLQHFLMLHRTHELRVLPDTVDVYATDVGFPHSFPCEDDADPEYDRQKFLGTDVNFLDPQAEVKSLPDDLVERLKEF